MVRPRRLKERAEAPGPGPHGWYRWTATCLACFTKSEGLYVRHGSACERDFEALGRWNQMKDPREDEKWTERRRLGLLGHVVAVEKIKKAHTSKGVGSNSQASAISKESLLFRQVPAPFVAHRLPHSAR